MTEDVVWWLYILDCDGRLYTGVTTDPDRRLAEHRAGSARGARFTRGARRITLRYAVRIGKRGTALAAEYRLRRLKRGEKLAIIRTAPGVADLLDFLPGLSP